MHALHALLSFMLTDDVHSGSNTSTNRFEAIRDQYASLDGVKRALRSEGLEFCNLIVAVDFTAVSRRAELLDWSCCEAADSRFKYWHCWAPQWSYITVACEKEVALHCSSSQVRD